MNTLFEKSIRTLELPAVLEMLAALAVSDAAKEKCRNLTPVCELEEALHLQAETQSARDRLGLYGSPSFSGVKDVSRALSRADHGGVLNTRELLDVADLLTASRRVSEYDREKQEEKTVLDHLFSALHTNKFLEEKIHGAILDEETIADTASPELADIRRKMRLASSKGRQILQRILAYARQIYQSLAQGETTYLTVTSLKPISNYTNPDNTCVVRAHRLWNELFAKEYGEVIAPIKVPMFPLRSLGKIRTVNGVKEAVLDPQLYAELRQVKPRFAERLKRWFTPDKLLPSNMLLSPLLPEIPREAAL